MATRIIIEQKRRRWFLYSFFKSMREASLEQRFQSNGRIMVTLFVRMERRMVVLLLFSLRLESEEERKKISRTIIEKLYVWRVFVDRRIEVLWRCDERPLEEDKLPVLENHQGPIIIHDQETPVPNSTRRSFSQHCTINYIYIYTYILLRSLLRR